MKALVTGAGGQLGRALLDAAPTGWTVTGLTRAELDIGDPTQVHAVLQNLRPDVLINAGAYTAVDRAEADSEMAWRANGHAPGILAAEMASLGGRMVHVSTDFVFDGSLSRPYRPDDAVSPLGVYGVSKRAGEEAVLSASDGFLVVRTGWVYSHTGANFLRTMLRIMGERGQVNVVSDQVGTPTSARNLAAALWALADSPAAGILHFSDAGVASWYDFAQAIAEEAVELGMLPASVGVTPIPARDYPTAAQRPAYSVLDKSLTWSLLNRTGPHWRQALRVVLNDLRRTNDV